MKQNLSPFYATRQTFQASLVTPILDNSLSYEEWMEIPEEKKSVALFLNFFEPITLAWFKTKSFYTLEEDGVSCMMQYLEKNVPILKENPKRFTAKYIYRVAYNCLYCICHDIKRDRVRWETEVSNVVAGSDGTELDLFDTVTENTIERAMKAAARDSMWMIIETLDKDTKTFIQDMLDSTNKSKMSEEAKSVTLTKLRSLFKDFVPVLCD